MDAVLVGPVSGLDSLLTGKFTGNFVGFVFDLVFCNIFMKHIQWLVAEFPTQANRDFFGANSEFNCRNSEYLRLNSEPAESCLGCASKRCGVHDSLTYSEY